MVNMMSRSPADQRTLAAAVDAFNDAESNLGRVKRYWGNASGMPWYSEQRRAEEVRVAEEALEAAEGRLRAAQGYTYNA